MDIYQFSIYESGNLMMGLNMDFAGQDGKDEQTYSIIGAAMKVHRELGIGFLELVYQEAIETEFLFQHIPYERERMLPVHYRDKPIAQFRVDFLCYGEIIVELKALKSVSKNEESQVINYLKASCLHRALLINFGARKLQFKRFVFSCQKFESTNDDTVVEL